MLMEYVEHLACVKHRGNGGNGVVGKSTGAWNDTSGTGHISFVSADNGTQHPGANYSAKIIDPENI